MGYISISNAEISNGRFGTETLFRKFRDNIEADGPPYTAGDYVLYANDAERSQISSSYVKLKEIRVARDGVYRILFDLKSSSAGYGVYGQIYKNGTAVGTERTMGSTTPQTFIEDISGVLKGDLIQIYGKASTAPFYISNMKVCCAEEGILPGY